MLPRTHSLVSSLTLLLSVASAALSAAPRDAADGFTLSLLAGQSALCLDGSPGGFYYRPGFGEGPYGSSTWIIELEGGGWCMSLSDCAGRAKTDIGSSKSWPATGVPGMDGGANGWLSSDCSVNKFCNASKLHFNYCDGGSFAGYRAAAVPSGGSPSVDLFFRGASIFDASVEAALALGMQSATNIILKGCSAGGLAAWLHADYFAERMAVVPQARVVTVPDAGFFLNHTNAKGVNTIASGYKWVAETMNTTQVNAGCLAAHGGDLATCFLAEKTLPFVTSAVFATQDLVDSWQMGNIFDCPGACCSGNSSACTPAELAAMNGYRADMLALLAPLTKSTSNGAFLSSCVQHCHQNIDAIWTQELVQGQSVQATFLRWWTAAGAGQPLVIDGPFGTNKHCFGVPYSCAAAGGRL